MENPLDTFAPDDDSAVADDDYDDDDDDYAVGGRRLMRGEGERGGLHWEIVCVHFA